MTMEILIEDPRWTATGLNVLAQGAEKAILAQLALDRDTVEISLLACDDARIAALNGQFRGKSTPTNVLSWPSGSWSPTHLPPHGELGDIAIAYDTCVREAQAQGKPLADHVTHLVVHGVLHLFGFDHESDAQAAEMEGFEVEILARLDLPDPYRGTGAKAP